ALVVAQVALSLVLVVGGGLFVQSFARLGSVRLGYDPNPILIADISSSRSTVKPEGRPALFERVRQSVLGVPGVQQAAASVITPITNSSWDTLIENLPGQSLPEPERNVFENAMTPGWFATYGTPILAGRDFTVHDTIASPKVILVNETFVKKYFGGTNPIGKTIREISSPGEESPALEIVGIVRDALYLSPREGVPPTMYVSLLQRPRNNPPAVDLAIRVAQGSPAQ